MTLLSPEDVALRCGLSRKAVYRAIDRGELKASRLCSRLRIRPEDVDTWFDRNCVTVDQPTWPTDRMSLPTADGLRSLLRDGTGNGGV